jgi:hypothetical protein
MKQLLSILGIIGVATSGVSSIIATSTEIKTDNSKNSQNQEPLSKIIDVPKSVTVFIGKFDYAFIRNFRELTNVTVKSENENIATAKRIQDRIGIIGITKGTVNVIVSADDAPDATIAVTVNELEVIDVAQNAAVDVDQVIGLKINNFSDLTNVNARSNNKEIVEARIFEDDVLIKGKKQGTTTITVSANDAQNVTITVTVNEMKVIAVDNDNVIVYGTDQKEVKITNFSDLTGVEVKSGDNSIATASLDTQGLITITGVMAGSTTVKVIADHAKEKVIAVEVKALSDINVDRNQVTVYDSIPEKISITNAADLTGVEVTSINNEVVTVTFDRETGIVTIVKAPQAKIGDETTVEITADHAKKTIIQVTITNQLALIDKLTNLAIDNVQEDQVIDEVVKLNPILTKTDIKIRQDSFQAPVGLKFGLVTIESNTNKYTGEIKLLIVPQVERDEWTKLLLSNLKIEKDANKRKPLWKDYFEYKGRVFFETLMPANSWSFKNSDFEITGAGDKQLKRDVLKHMARQLDAVVRCLMNQDYRDYEITRDYSGYQYKVDSNYKTKVIGNDVSIYFSGYYTFDWADLTNFIINFAGEIKGTITD